MILAISFSFFSSYLFFCLHSFFLLFFGLIDAMIFPLFVYFSVIRLAFIVFFFFGFNFGLIGIYLDVMYTDDDNGGEVEIVVWLLCYHKCFVLIRWCWWYVFLIGKSSAFSWCIVFYFMIIVLILKFCSNCNRKRKQKYKDNWLFVKWLNTKTTFKRKKANKTDTRFEREIECMCCRK